MSLEWKLTCCVFPEGSEFWQWLEHSLHGAAGYLPHRFTAVMLSWVSPATKRRDQLLIWKSVLTKKKSIGNCEVCRCSVWNRSGTDRNGNEVNISEQRIIPSLLKQKTHHTRVNGEKFSHCAYKYFIQSICCIDYTRDFWIELIYLIASSLLFVRSLGTINEGDWGIWIKIASALYGTSLPSSRVSVNYYPLCKLVCFFMRRQGTICTMLF